MKQQFLIYKFNDNSQAINTNLIVGFEISSVNTLRIHLKNEGIIIVSCKDIIEAENLLNGLIEQIGTNKDIIIGHDIIAPAF